MPEVWSVLGWISLGVFLGMLAVIVAVRLLLRYLAVRILATQRAASRLFEQAQRSLESALQDKQEAERLDQLTSALIGEIEEIDRRLAKAQADPDAAIELSALRDQKEELTSQAKELGVQLSRFRTRNAEAIADNQVDNEAKRLLKLAHRTRRLLSFVELLSNVDITRSTGPGGSK